MDAQRPVVCGRSVWDINGGFRRLIRAIRPVISAGEDLQPFLSPNDSRRLRRWRI